MPEEIKITPRRIGGVHALHLYKIDDPLRCDDLDVMVRELEDPPRDPEALIGARAVHAYRDNNIRRKMSDNGWPLPDGARIWGFTERQAGAVVGGKLIGPSSGKRPPEWTAKIAPIDGAPMPAKVRGLYCLVQSYKHGWVLVVPNPGEIKRTGSQHRDSVSVKEAQELRADLEEQARRDRDARREERKRREAKSKPSGPVAAPPRKQQAWAEVSRKLERGERAGAPAVEEKPCQVEERFARLERQVDIIAEAVARIDAVTDGLGAVFGQLGGALDEIKHEINGGSVATLGRLDAIDKTSSADMTALSAELRRVRQALGEIGMRQVGGDVEGVILAGIAAAVAGGSEDAATTVIKLARVLEEVRS